MATREEREDANRQLACLAFFLALARAGPPGLDDNVVRITWVKDGIEEVLELEKFDSIAIGGRTPTGEGVHVSSEDIGEGLRVELHPRNCPARASALEHLAEAAG